MGWQRKAGVATDTDSEPQREKEPQRAGSTFKKGIAGRLRGSRVRAGRLSPGIEAGVGHSMPRPGFPGQKGAVCQDSSLREVACEEVDNWLQPYNLPVRCPPNHTWLKFLGREISGRLTSFPTG